MKTLKMVAMFGLFMVSGFQTVQAKENSFHSIIGDVKRAVYIASERSGDSELIENLVFAGAQEIEALTYINPKLGITKDEKGRTPLHMAALYGYIDIVDTLLKNPEVQTNIDIEDNDGMTAYDYASLHAGSVILR